jgi:hypothetical protein
MAYRKMKASRPEHLQPLSDLHVDLIQLGNAIAGRHPNAGLDSIKTEEQGGIYLRQMMLDFIESNRQITLAAEAEKLKASN